MQPYVSRTCTHVRPAKLRDVTQAALRHASVCVFMKPWCALYGNLRESVCTGQGVLVFVDMPMDSKLQLPTHTRVRISRMLQSCTQTLPACCIHQFQTLWIGDDFIQVHWLELCGLVAHLCSLGS